MERYWEKFALSRMERRRLLKGGAAFSTGAAALALIGCGSDDNGGGDQNDTPDNSAAGDPVRGGRLGTYFSSTANYNVVSNYHDGYNVSGVTVYDRLITARLDKRGYVLEAAASAEVPDPLRVVIKLKDGMTFANKAPVNGRAVTAQDIVATQDYVKALPNAENSSFQRLFVERMEAPDAKTVIYHLKKPSAYLFSSTYLANPTAQPIIPKDMLEVLDTAPPIGSGPFQLAEHTFNTRYLFTRNEAFREAKKNQPYLAEREIITLTDAVAQEAAFRSGQIHAWTPPASAVGRLLNELDSTKFSNAAYLSTGITGMNVNMDPSKGVKPWHDVRVREAFYRLMDRQQFITLVLDGRAVIPPGPVMAGLEAFQLDPKATEKYFKHDVAAAKQLLSAANFDLGKSYEVICSSTSATNANLAEVWSQQMAQADVKVAVSTLPFAEWLPKRIAPGEFEIVIGGQPGGDTPSRALRNHHSDTLDQYNHVGLYDKNIDALIEKSEITSDAEEHVKLVKQIQDEVLKKYSMSYVYATQQLTGFRNGKLQNWEENPLAGQNNRIEVWFSA